MTTNHIKACTSLVVREIETAMKFHSIPDRMITTKKTDNTTCWWGCGAIGILMRCWQKYKSSRYFGKLLAASYQVKYMYLPHDPASSPIDILPKEIKPYAYKKNFFKNAHSFILDSSKLKITWTSINRRLCERIV